MSLTILITCVLIAVLCVNLLGGIVTEGHRRMQSRRSRNAVERWVREAMRAPARVPTRQA